MKFAYGASDIAICRAGASSLFELAYARIPMILIPLGLEASRGDQIINAQIVELAFEMKNSKVSSMTELYVRRNIQDYYIKFCESGVSKKEMEFEMTMKDGISKPLKLEVEIKDGLWDSCDPYEMVQSRTGKYIVVYRIIKN